ncbi:methyltransferase family protein [Stackebrandtia albiflava]|uniref:Methyltransferase family protein n=1 Tax=Stackebrandtia albiflava TaxID=406432 RepID=A0A562VDS7_9ACTN|nr:class I SAM-dependent methyltransferase [Stackebrandtia albiflava]TWJ16034.1 methyltransferase family protein [Stackebrandtia albiflava]
MTPVPDLTVTADTDPYGAVAGLYDLLHVGPGSAELVGFFADMAPEGGDALEIGPGTGRMTMAVARRAGTVTCLERSPTMRAVLLTKLAADPGLRDRVTVLDVAAPGFDLGRRFDYVYLSAVYEHVPPTARPALFETLAAHLAPGGVLAMDMVEDEVIPDLDEHEVRAAVQGECRYTLSTEVRPVTDDLARVRHVYRTWSAGEEIGRHVVERDHHMHRPAGVVADLAAAGLVPVGGTAIEKSGTPLDDKGTLVARLAHDR